MSKFLPVIIALTSLSMVSVQAGAAVSKSDADSVCEPQKTWYGEELYLKNMRYGAATPTSIAYTPYSAMNDIKASARIQRGLLKPYDGARKANLYDFTIYGIKKLEKVAFEGGLEYNLHDLNDMRWNSTLFTSSRNPYIIADTLRYDSLQNNVDRETFTLNGGFTYKVSDKVLLGIRADYKVGSKGDQSDPRALAKGSRVAVNPGVDIKFNEGFTLGIAAEAGVYHENVSVTVEDNINPDHTILLLYNQLGKYESKDATGYYRRYNGTVFGGSVNALNGTGKVQNFAELSFTMNTEKSVDGSSWQKLGGDWMEMVFGLKDRLQIATPSMLHNIELNAGMLMGSATYYDQKLTHDEFAMEVWEVNSSEVVQMDNDITATIQYRGDFLKGSESHLTVRGGVGMDMVNVNEYPDEYYAKYSLLHANAGITKRFFAQKMRYSISADGKYTKALSELDYSLPFTKSQDKRYQNGYTLPKYNYLAADRFDVSVKADASVPIVTANGKKTWLKFTAGYQYAGYLGKYTRLEGTNRTEINASLNYTF